MNLPSTEHTIKREDCLIHYWLTGLEGRPLVVFTHGAGINHHEFDAQVPLIAQQYRVLTWDVRGHGLSQLREKDFKIRDALDDLLAIIELLGYKQAIFVGHSMGGNIHQELVFQYPGCVQALVMLGCTCNTLRLSRLEILQTQIAIPLLRLYPWSLLVQQMAEVSAKKVQSRLYLKQAFEQISKKDFIAVMAELLKVLHYEPDYQITQPLLLVHGDDDRTGNIKKVAPIWAAREPNCHYQVIPDAGHAANLDNPVFLNNLLYNFIREQAQ